MYPTQWRMTVVTVRLREGWYSRFVQPPPGPSSLSVTHVRTEAFLVLCDRCDCRIVGLKQFWRLKHNGGRHGEHHRFLTSASVRPHRLARDNPCRVHQLKGTPLPPLLAVLESHFFAKLNWLTISHSLDSWCLLHFYPTIIRVSETQKGALPFCFIDFCILLTLVWTHFVSSLTCNFCLNFMKKKFCFLNRLEFKLN